MSDSTPLFSKRIAFLCSLGLFLAGYIFYSSALIESYYAKEFILSSWQIGIAQSAVPLGAIVGALIAGRLADFFGRHRLLNWNFLALIFTGLLGVLLINFYSLCFIRLISGFLAGTLYPLCAAYLTEMIPHKTIARQTAILMFINCLAAPVACALAILLNYFCDRYILWRVLSVCYIVPACFAYLCCKRLPESHEWLLIEPKNIKLLRLDLFRGLTVLFRASNRSITLTLMGAWFLMDVAYYGINFFIPYLLSAIQFNTLSSDLNHLNPQLLSTLLINLFFLLGAFAAIFVVETVALIKLQKYGFLFSGLSLVLLAVYLHTDGQQNGAVILLFIIFNFALNIGPDVTTYLLSAISYPVKIRASAHGFLTSFAKLGSFLGVLFLPYLQQTWGNETILFFLAVLLFCAFGLTISFSKAILNDRREEGDEVIYETN